MVAGQFTLFVEPESARRGMPKIAPCGRWCRDKIGEGGMVVGNHDERKKI
jgi:hypothetical protein